MTIDFSQFISFLKDKKTLLFVFEKKQVDLDFLAFLTSFSLLNEKNDVNISLLSNYLPGSEYKVLAGFENISSKLPKENLVLSFDYDQKQVDKITYQINEEENKFLLTIKPQTKVQPLDFRKINFSYSGRGADGIVFCDIDNINSLGKIYHNYKIELSRKENVFYLNSKIKKQNKTNNLLNLENLTWSEFLAQLIIKMEYKFDQKIANNLIKGIDFKTKKMTTVDRSETFEVMAWLIKKGGERKIISDNQLRQNKTKKYNNELKEENKNLKTNKEIILEKEEKN